MNRQIDWDDDSNIPDDELIENMDLTKFNVFIIDNKVVVKEEVGEERFLLALKNRLKM